MGTKSAGILNGKRIHEIFVNCIFKDKNGQTRTYLEVEGVMSDTYLDGDRLESHKDEILRLLDELPDEFKTPEGASFLDACKDRRGEQWTYLHFPIDELFQLGMGIEKILCLTPRDMWETMPGGVPNYRIN